MYPLFLIGFMGSGKSTIGKGLSEHFNCTIVDLDDYIEKKHGREIKDIFAEYGEDTFREYESEALKEVLSIDIIATGGGIVERKVNIQTMKGKGTIVYLHTGYSEIDRRLQGDETRPLWVENDEKTKRALFERRHHLYEAWADVVISTDGKSVEDLILELANKFPFNEHTRP